MRLRVPLLDPYTNERVGLTVLSASGLSALSRLADAAALPLPALHAALAEERATADAAGALAGRRREEAERARGRAKKRSEAVKGAREGREALQAQLCRLTDPNRALQGVAGEERESTALKLEHAKLRREHAAEVLALSALLDKMAALEAR